MEISKGVKKAIVGALLFLALGISALGGFGVHQGGAVSDVPAAHAGGVGPPPGYDSATPTPVP